MGSRTNFYVDIMAMQQEVTGTGNICNVRYPDGEKTCFLVDCGMFQEQQYNMYNKSLAFNPANIAFIAVTHNHIDHTGRLPFVVKNGYNHADKKIYMTLATSLLLPYALFDSHKVLNEVAKKKAEKCLYSESDVEQALKLMAPCNFKEEVRVDDHIKLTFLPNGHLIGAALILIQISYPGYEDINLLFTGDYNEKNMFFDVDPIPEWIKDLNLTIIQESTYGNMDSSEITEVYQKNILETLKDGGTVITPVFSLGRSQELLYILKKMQKDGILSTSIPIYLDGKLAIKYTELYLQADLGIKDEMKDFLPDNLIFVTKDFRPELLSNRNCKIILTTSGMGSYGPAQMYIPEFLPIKNALIHFTGYTAEGTLGYRLKNTPIGSEVSAAGLMLTKQAVVEYTNEFSAHAKSDILIKFLQQFKKIKLVLVTHGNSEVKELYTKRVVKEVKPKNAGILGRDYLFRIDPYGLVKTMGTKFN